MPFEQIDIVGPVVAAAAGALQRIDLREFRFPEAQHVLRHVELFGHFADSAERVRRFCDRRMASLITSTPLLFGRRSRLASLIIAFSTWLGRNTSTRRGVIGTSSPVLGLRPMRPPFGRTANVPNDDKLHRLAADQARRNFFQHPFDHLGRFVARQTDLGIDRLGQIGRVKVSLMFALPDWRARRYVTTARTHLSNGRSAAKCRQYQRDR